MGNYDGTLESLFTLPPRTLPTRRQFVGGREVTAPERRKRRKSKRDAQRTRLYSAENTAFGSRTLDMSSPALEACQALVDRIYKSSWLKKNYPRTCGAGWYRINVIGGNGNNADSHRIMLTAQGRLHSWIVIHELAHTLTSRQYRYSYGNETVAAHGREYANIYLALVRRWMGRDDYLRLRACFKLKRVRYSLPRKRTGPKRPGNSAALAAYRASRLAAKP